MILPPDDVGDLPSGWTYIDLAPPPAREVEELFRQHQSEVYHFFYRRTRDHHLSADLVQETFIKVHRNISRFEDQGKEIIRWVMVIARNVLYDHYRKVNNKAVVVDMAMVDHEASPENLESELVEKLDQADNRLYLQQLFELLTPIQRVVMEYRYFQDRTYDEIARLLDRQVTAVKQIHARALRTLKMVVRNADGGESVWPC